MNDKLNFLLKKYSVGVNAEMQGETAVLIGEKKIPLLPWESERRFIELRKLVVGKRIGNMCTYRIGNTASKATDIFGLLKRESGIIEYTVYSQIKEIFAILGKNTMNVIAETKNGCVCTIELACTLNEGEKPIEKHEIITDNGIACDMVVDTQIPQSSIYLFTNSEKKDFTDIDAELYGCTINEAAAIRNAFSVCKSEAQAKYNVRENVRLEKIVSATKESIKTLSNVKVCD